MPRVNTYTPLAERGLLALDLAIILAGSQSNLAQTLGITVRMISQWKKRERYVPVQYVTRVCAVCSHPKITPYTLRPDLAADWQRLGPMLAKCGAGHARTSPLDPFEVDAEQAMMPPPPRGKRTGRPVHSLARRIAEQLQAERAAAERSGATA
ncbi:transcriptional regulator [Paraburkholderia sp.]|jgi:DNA-binding transcriptional regulator YdaS (Cro superfamily)|uniref:transcriptional regulator n=1 Tax=Paraburkholderia sp. TaxID=1926495 RepID=UPI002F42B413